MSMPFIEMPQRAEHRRERPRAAVAARAADWLALPSTMTAPDIRFSASPVPALPRTCTVASLFMPAHSSRRGLDLDVDLGVEPAGDACAPFGLRMRQLRTPSAARAVAG